jgi:hypothetical protein
MKFKLPCLFLAILAATTAFAESVISVIVDGQPVAFGAVGPMRSKGRVMVPLRGVLEKIGATVDWDGAAQKITAERDDHKIELTIGEAFGRINDQDVPLDVPARVFKGTTFVPLRFMGSALHARVDWDEATSTVRITTR